jgi:cytochrome c-type biogenesis protein CcmH
MKLLLLALLFSIPAFASTGEISGDVNLAKGVALSTSGVLFVFAKKSGNPMPVAVVRFPNPKFPVHFTLSEKNAMTPGTPFTGPFSITARYSPSGNAMDKSGPEGTEPKPVEVGRSDLKLDLKAK